MNSIESSQGVQGNTGGLLKGGYQHDSTPMNPIPTVNAIGPRKKVSQPSVKPQKTKSKKQKTRKEEKWEPKLPDGVDSAFFPKFKVSKTPTSWR